MTLPSIAAPPVRMTLEAFLDYGEPDRRYELVRGVPVEMPPPSALHQVICVFALHHFSRAIVERRLPYVATLLAVQTEADTVRVPDVVVWRRVEAAAKAAVRGDGVIRLGSEVVLVAEVVSRNRREDYEVKRGEYARRGVETYVLFDVERWRVVVLDEPEAGEGRYRVERVYGRGERFGLRVLGGYEMSVDEVLGGGFVEDELAEEMARMEAAQRGQLEAEACAKAERRAKLEAEAQAKEAEGRIEAERRAKLEAEARAEAERRAREALAEQLARLRAQLGLPPDAEL